MAVSDQPETVIPLHEESLTFDTRRVERSRVRVSTKVVEHERLVRQSLEQEEVEVTRVPVDRAIDEYPGIRQDGDLTIVPLVEEILVVERRLMLREEIHIRKTRHTVDVEQPVTTRSEEVCVERIDASGTASADTTVQPEE
ncbi:YsnF/AvaK domain-containing protein [Azospirillum doebereinerae]|uniref:DUF2382 domain-containing protein n=1 Tax=Azospirillum doebereinerae TaxID=92933 RepID=A0A3S0WLS4_9PROT|nr:DUF2382 domain-containing protein [Azospirillum doebereinerae]RUQ70725.1 DUF2382 domain-containing protein [Azospirillum doebereinerae]